MAEDDPDHVEYVQRSTHLVSLVLASFRDNGPVVVGHLASMAGLPRGTVRGALGRLAKAGFRRRDGRKLVRKAAVTGSQWHWTVIDETGS